MPSTLERLATWYRRQCNGEWEHGYGIEIETLDNPGWSMTIDIANTALADEPFAEQKSEYEDDARWCRCWKEGTKFHAVCGPELLEAALLTFLKWAEGQAVRGAG